MAVLLARANQGVNAEHLIREVWEESPPRRATSSLYVYVSQLRKLLRAPQRETPIVTRSRGYMLCVEIGEFDVDDFSRLAERGRSLFHAGRHDEAVAVLDAALRLWRGPAFGNLGGGPIVQAYSTWLEESRLECQELLLEAELMRGRHREIIGGLQALTTEHPLRESFYQKLMMALYRADRRAEALEVYRTAAMRLWREIGIQPGRTLQDLHQSILHGETPIALCSSA